jgi:membrane protease YdiL (CAAX protease family)
MEVEMSEKVINRGVSVAMDNNKNEAKDQYALVEVISFFMLFFLLIKYLSLTSFGVAQLKFVGWDFFAHTMMVVMPLLALKLGKRPLSEIGISRDHINDPEVRRISRVVFFEIGLIWCVALLIPHLLIGSQPHLLLPPSSFATSLNVDWKVAGFIGWALTLFFTMIFCGFGEEVFFRGYIQGRLNKQFGRPFQIFGVSFGWGLIITSLIFGIGHGLSGFNPFSHDPFVFRPEPIAGVATFFEGAILGLLYEKTGGIVAPAALHAAIGLFFGAVVF